MLVVAYDIPDDRRRRRLHERLMDHGVPVQYSVFEVPDNEHDDMVTMLRQETRRKDAVRVYHLCGRCLSHVESLGTARPLLEPETPQAVLEMPAPLAEGGVGSPAGRPGCRSKSDSRVRRPGPLERGVVLPHSRLMALVCAMENLQEAFLDVRRNRGCAGSDGESIAAFDRRRAERLADLQSALVTGSYDPRSLRPIPVAKPDGGTRVLRVPCVRDRVAQQALLRVIAPLWDREFEECSFAYRRGRSVRRAIAAVVRARNAGYRWVLESDIEHFFDEVDHGLVLERFRKVVADDDVVRLVQAWMEAPTTGAVDGADGGRGLPQGSAVSPLLSNVFLDEFDEEMLALGYRLVRYADDFVVVCVSRTEAEEACKDAERILGACRLKLKREKTRVTSFDQGFRYLGHVFTGDTVIRSPTPRPAARRPRGGTD